MSVLPPPFARVVELGTFEAVEGWVGAFEEATYVHGGALSRRLTTLDATQRTFAPVVDVSGTTTLKVWTMLRNGTPGSWSANLILTMFNEDFTQKVVSFPLAFNHADGVDVWIERSAPVEWFPLDPTQLWLAIFSLQAISFGGGLAYIDDWRATA